MWSLPDINTMNARAAKGSNDLLESVEHPEKHKCDHCDKKATVGAVYYDIFSDDPKGADFACEDHEHRIDEDDYTFICDSCDRRMVDHYTWERYEVDGVCLKCAAKAYFENGDNWLEPESIKKVQLGSTGRKGWFDEGNIYLRNVPHVLGVKQPIPDGYEFIENFEFDTTDGHQISGGDMLHAIQKLDGPFTIVMDAAYQFAVSFGIYQRKLSDGEKVQATARKAGWA